MNIVLNVTWASAASALSFWLCPAACACQIIVIVLLIIINMVPVQHT